MTDQENLFPQPPPAPPPPAADATAGPPGVPPETPARPARARRKAAAPPELPFEEALARLEAVVAEMERGDLSMEDCLKRFEEGTALARSCRRRLQETEKRVEILLKDEAGKEQWQPLASEDDEEKDADTTASGEGPKP